MFDPVSDHQRRRRARKKIEERFGLHEYTCNNCGKKVKKVYSGRCLNCAARIEEAKFHHRIPKLEIVTLKKGKKKVDTPGKKKC